MSLQEPTAKMSKSDRNPDNYLALLDSPEEVSRKIRRAVTDSGRTVAYDAQRPGIANLVTLYSCVTGASFEEIEQRFTGKGYGQFKAELADAAISFLDPIREKYRAIRSDQIGLEALLKRGADVARDRARVTLAKVHDAVGFIPAT
jgi:tryptophanyl-tRNA synthetase